MCDCHSSCNALVLETEIVSKILNMNCILNCLSKKSLSHAVTVKSSYDISYSVVYTCNGEGCYVMLYYVTFFHDCSGDFSIPKL